MKKVLIAVLALAVVGIGVAGWLSQRPRSRKAPNGLNAVLVVAPVPVPTGEPTTGPEGFDEEGYPRRQVDQAALRALLLAERYGELARWFEDVQGRLDRDFHYEAWARDTALAFQQAESWLEPLFDTWVGEEKASFAPLLARGAFRLAMAWESRGGRFVDETPASQLAAMEKWARLALTDLDAALARRSGLVAAHFLKIEARQLLGTDPRDELDRALAACPLCYYVRYRYLGTLRPRWGGSAEQMAAFAKAHDLKTNPRLHHLGSAAHLDAADVAMAKGDYAAAARALKQAETFGESGALLVTRSTFRRESKPPDLEGALADARRACELLNNQETRGAVVTALLALGREEEAGRELLAMARAAPASWETRRLGLHVSQRLVRLGFGLHEAGKTREALELYALALEIDPENGDAIARQRSLLVRHAKELGLPAMQARARKDPDDFVLRQALDAAYIQAQDGRSILAMWGEYLANHPEDCRAWLERAGTNHLMGQHERSLDDARRACELGCSGGCLHAWGLRQR